MKIKNLLPALIIFLTFQFTNAMVVKNLKGAKLLLDLQGQEVKVGDSISTNNGVATILQIKNGQAVAQIQSGTFSINDSVQLVTSSKKTNNPNLNSTATNSSVVNSNSSPNKNIKSNSKVNKDLYSRSQRIKGAILAKFMYNKMNTKQKDNTSSPGPNEEFVTMTGFNPGLFASLEYPWLNWLTLRGTLGYEMVSIGGTAQFQSCDNKSSTDCKATIHYLTGIAMGRFDITNGSNNFWTAIGGALKFPISKSSTALREEDISMANTIVLTFGLDYHMNNRNFIPISFEYHYSLNQSDTVPEISQFGLQAGYGMQF